MRVPPPVLSLSLTVLLVAGTIGPGSAELTISNLSVYLNDSDVTVQVAVLGAIPPGSPRASRAASPPPCASPWSSGSTDGCGPIVSSRPDDRTPAPLQRAHKRIQGRVAQRRDPRALHLARARDAQRVLSELRGLKLLPATELQPTALFYVRVHAEAALNGRANTLLTRLSGEATRPLGDVVPAHGEPDPVRCAPERPGPTQAEPDCHLRVLILLVVATAFEFGIRTPDIPVASTIVVFALFNLNLMSSSCCSSSSSGTWSALLRAPSEGHRIEVKPSWSSRSCCWRWRPRS